MERIREQELIEEYNRVYGEILCCERRKRKISLEALSSGIMSRTALEKAEKGKAQWPKLAGDTLMLRMGIPLEFFESVASGAELEKWRLREDICLLIPGREKDAVKKLEAYRARYKNRESLEEQFLMKAEVILMLSGELHTGQGARNPMEAETILNAARKAAGCTIREGWEQDLRTRWLSSGELEAVLLVGAALFLNGSEQEAWGLWQAVWDYPAEHDWGERAKAMILPQAAILGIWQMHASRQSGSAGAMQGISGEDIVDRGRTALELLRRNSCHCYALPLMDCLCRVDSGYFKSQEELQQIRKFREMFREIYEWFDYPAYRIWQGISVDNTRDAGITLKMLRKFYGKAREKAVYDGAEKIVTPRQLEKIEKGTHKPSYENYGRLMKQYGKYGGWNMPLLETDSMEILEKRQLISTLLERNEWQQAEWEIQKFRETAKPKYPRMRQELLFFDAALKLKREGASQECIDILLEALHCTVPDFEDRDMKWWVFQREEIMIASNIGSLYLKLGNLDASKRWFESVLFSIEHNCERTGICNYGYDVAAEGYDNYLGEVQCFDAAIKMSEKIVGKSLLLYRISSIQRGFYHIAWNAYEEAVKNPEEGELLRRKWRKAFSISMSMAEFMYDAYLTAFLEKRVTKYLS